MEISAILMGQRVRSARKSREISTEELAEKVGVAVESIGHIECGARKPSLTLLYNIAEVLDVSLDYLTGRTETTSDALLHECAEHNGLTPGAGTDAFRALPQYDPHHQEKILIYYEHQIIIRHLIRTA